MKKFTLEDLETVNKNPLLLNEINKLISTYGAFVITDCFNEKEVEVVHTIVKNLFSKTEKEKMEYKVDKLKDLFSPGFIPYGITRAMDTGIPNSLEAWDFSHERNWPIDMKKDADIILAYSSKLYEVTKKALNIISVVLDVPPNSLQGLVGQKNGTLHLLHYFKNDKKFGKRSRRQSKHCDNRLLSLIPSPDPINTGIKLFNRKTKKWEKIIIEKKECLIQIGLLLQRLTNNKVRANLHTVDTPKVGAKDNLERYSTPFFVNPSPNVILKVFDKFKKGRKIYPDVLVREAEKDFFEKIFRKK